MTMKPVIVIGAIILMWLAPVVTSVNAITNSTANVNRPIVNQISDLRINPYFAPDESCDFNVQQLQCIPGKDQDCNDIPGFAGNEDGLCHLSGDCTAGYHSSDEDESGQCYPDTEPCWPDYVRNQTDPNDRSCHEDSSRDGFPDQYCLTNPDQEKCNVFKPIPGAPNLCPDNFAVMNSANFTVQKCVPEDHDQLVLKERRQQVEDPDRCAPGYKLNIPEHINIHQFGGTIGTCNPID